MADIRVITPKDYISEYNSLKPSLWRGSENLDTIIESIFTVIDSQQTDLIYLANNILSVDLATGAQLDFIGNIVGQPRFLIDFTTEVYFGFDGAYQSETFGSRLDSSIGGYWNSRSYFDTASARRLSDDEYRRIIKARTIYNSSSCNINELVEVINLITNTNSSVIQTNQQGVVSIKTDDSTGLLSYFASRTDLIDNILPVPAGVFLSVSNTIDDGSDTAIGRYANELETLVNQKLPEN